MSIMSCLLSHNMLHQRLKFSQSLFQERRTVALCSTQKGGCATTVVIECQAIKMNADLDTQGSNDASGTDEVVLAQVIQGLIEDDCTSLEPYWLLELDAPKLL